MSREEVWTLTTVAALTPYLWFLISAVSDVTRRSDLPGRAKAGWTLLIIVAPLAGGVAYLIVRPQSARARGGSIWGLRDHRTALDASSPTSMELRGGISELDGTPALTETEYATLKAWVI